MKKQVGRPPEKRQRIGPRKILRSKKDKKTCPGQGQGRKRGNAAHDERLAAAGAACRAYAPPDPAPAHKTGACISPPTAKIRSGRKRTSSTPLLGCRRLHTTMRRAPPLKPLRQAVDPGAAACRPSPAAAAPATTGGGSAVVRGLSCASCTPAKIIGQIPMCRSLPDGKLTKSAPHRFPDGNFYSAAPGMISDTARKKHSARPPISPQPAGGDEKRPITLRGNFLTEPLSGQ